MFSEKEESFPPSPSRELGPTLEGVRTKKKKTMVTIFFNFSNSAL